VTKTQLSIYAAHPIMYQTPIFAALQRRIDEAALPLEMRVMFGDDLSLREVFYEETQVVFKPDTPNLLVGFPYIFLKNAARDARGGFFSRINLSILARLRPAETDVVLIHGYETATAWLALAAAKLSGVRVIWRGEALKRPAQSGLLAWVKQRLVTAFLRRCDAILYSCSGNREYLAQFFMRSQRAHFFAIPCAVDNAFFRAERARLLPLRPALRRDFGFADDAFVVVFCARLTERKRPLDLIRAIAAAREARLGALIVGDGPERARCEALAAKLGVNARFTGFVNQSEISRAYVCGDAAAVLSSYDPSPKALNEAMNFELPLLVSKGVGTVRDLVRDGENGFVIDVGDVATLRARLQRLAADRRAARRMGRSGAEIVADWSFEADADGLLAALAYLEVGLRDALHARPSNPISDAAGATTPDRAAVSN